MLELTQLHLTPTGSLSQQGNTFRNEVIVKVGILLHIDDEVGVNQEQATPFLGVPSQTLVVIPAKLKLSGVRLKITDHRTRRVHHFHSALLVAAIIGPRHTGLPTLVIVGHSHIVHRMDRHMNSALEALLVQALGVLIHKMLKTLDAVGLGNLADRTQRTRAIADFQLLAVLQPEGIALRTPRLELVLGEVPRIQQNIHNIIFVRVARELVEQSIAELADFLVLAEHLANNLLQFVGVNFILNRHRDTQLVAEQLEQMLALGVIPETQILLNAAPIMAGVIHELADIFFNFDAVLSGD